MNQPAKAHEPSMEEILASIRRIIADDDIPKAPQPAQMAPEPLPPPRPMMAPPPPPPPPAPEPEPIFEAPPPVIDQRFDLVVEEAQPEVEDSSDILELTEEMRAPEPAGSNFRTIDAQPDIMFAEEAPEPMAPAPSPMMSEEPPAMLSDHLEGARQALAEQMMDRPLLSNTASAAVDSAFGSLAHTVLAQNARTLDDLVKDMLRPMLKSWLDDNLPGLVERLVRAEIERVSRGR
jgi:cell pole-organizing protein PopZ